MAKIIGVVGLIGSGKDTVAEMLVADHGYQRESFAGTLKDAVAMVFGWDRSQLEGSSAQSRDWRETVDTWWAQRLEIPNLTPRWVLQQWGTEVCRRSFHDDIWIASLQNKLRNTNRDIVISDCRFPNELELIKNAGGKLIQVSRGTDPQWVALAVSANNGDVMAQEQLSAMGIHPSESSWIGSAVDQIIYNNGSLLELRAQVTDLTT
jgi:hypothetical protein